MAALIAAATMATAAPAQPAAETCRSVAPPPAALAGWSDRAPSGPPGGTIDVGRAVDLALTPIISEERTTIAPVARRYGGQADLRIAQAGRYRVALGNAAWVDLIRKDQRTDGTIASVGHDHGPPCTGIRKMVDFMLAPGRYGVLVKDSPTPTVPLMVARLP